MQYLTLPSITYTKGSVWNVYQQNARRLNSLSISAKNEYFMLNRKSNCRAHYLHQQYIYSCYGEVNAGNYKLITTK